MTRLICHLCRELTHPELMHAGEANRILLPVAGQNSVMLLDGDAHKEQRRFLMPAFRGSHLHSYVNTMTAIAEAEIARWPRGEPVGLHSRMQTLTLEVILVGAAAGAGTGRRAPGG